MIAQRLYTGETATQELQRKLREEQETILKDAALQFGCDTGQLAFRYNNLGVMEIHKMTEGEMQEMKDAEFKQKQTLDIKRKRGLLDG